jgi:hypothetical protein
MLHNTYAIEELIESRREERLREAELGRLLRCAARETSDGELVAIGTSRRPSGWLRRLVAAVGARA